MLTKPQNGVPAPIGRLAWRLVGTCGEAAAILTWLLLVLRDQYGIASLQAYDQVTLDALFLTAIAGTALARALNRRSASAGRLLVARLVLLCVVTVLAVVGAEYLARFEFRRARTSGNAGDYIAQSGRWSPGPSNSLGFREREIPPKSAARYRIAVIGDSFTWGQGIERNERYSNLLEQMLGPGYEVFNFAIPGDNMPEHLTRLTSALSVSPDFVLLELYINDWETPEMKRPHAYPLLPTSLDSRLEQSSQLYVLIRDQWGNLQERVGLSESYDHYMERNLRDPLAPNSREASAQLFEFFDRARAAGVPAGEILFPATDELGPHYSFGYLHERVRQTCAAEQVPCLDLLPVFSTFPNPRGLWVSPFDAHPNAIANRRAADAILQTFGPLWRR